MRNLFFGINFVILLTLIGHQSEAVLITRSGSSEDRVVASESAYCLAGGGGDSHWISGWNFLLQSASHGDVVIIRADGKRGAYEDWINFGSKRRQFPKMNSITTIVLEQVADAYSDEVLRQVRGAELIFFAGGSQAIYLRYLQNSPLLAELRGLAKKSGVSFAGTSAGAVFLGGTVFSARFSSPAEAGGNVRSEDVIGNPMGHFVDLWKGPLAIPFLQEVLVDTHFSERDRQGRLTGFLALAAGQSQSARARAIGIDEGTAFCFNSIGIGRVYGIGAVSFLNPNGPVERLEANRSLHWYQNGKAVLAKVLRESGSVFDLRKWNLLGETQNENLPAGSSGGVEEYWWVDGRNENSPHWGRSAKQDLP